MKKLINLIILVCLTAVFIPAGQPVLAADFHQDPDDAIAIFSGVALFTYYADTLDFLLNKDPQEVTNRMDKMPFANIPESLTDVTGNFASSTKSVAGTVVGIETQLDTLRQLRAQSRYDDTIALAQTIWDTITDAQIVTAAMEKAVALTGNGFKVMSSKNNSDIRIAYDRLVTLIQRTKELLDIYKNILSSTLSADVSQLKGVASTALTLTVVPEAAFVGDNIQVSGHLTSGDAGLAGRKIDILGNSALYGTAFTDNQGNYSITVTVPFEYRPTVQIQTTYFPQNEDIGKYLAAVSPKVPVDVLFYQTRLEFQTDNKTYPGRNLTVNGSIIYKAPGNIIPIPIDRSIEIYFDNELVTELTAAGAFSYTFLLAPDIKLGGHLITVTTSASGRYSPTFGDINITVQKATPVFKGKINSAILIPGNIKFEGQIISDLGALTDPGIMVNFGGNTYRFTGDTKGIVSSTGRTKYDFSLIGTQTLEMTITPTEPWNNIAVITDQVMVINLINCGLFLGVVLLSLLLIPRRVKIKWGQRPTKNQTLAGPNSPVSTAPIYQGTITVDRPVGATDSTPFPLRTENKSEIISLYRVTLILVEKITRIIFKPQETLREYARDVEKPLGKVGAFFGALTRIVEKAIYSPRRATEEEIKESRRISENIQQEIKK
ncbi:MAG: DUF4129 domain-containing protein [Dehalococcoidales bacterium]|nr:DUF4129 domain-containing protein [Dehalococcoidales bacterium]